MAEASLKLGGDWATKEGSLLGFNDQNGNYKPIPFDFTRATTATRVNRDGLIEEVQAGVPRIDFLDNPDGALLLEPQRTNLLENSQDFNGSNWVQNGSSITDNDIISPEGIQNGSKIEGDGSNANIRLYDNYSFPSTGDYTISVFAKAGTNDFLELAIFGVPGGKSRSFDLVNGTTPSADSKIESMGNGWYRCSFNVSLSGPDITGNYNVYVPYSIDTTPFPSAGDADGQNIYIYGLQLEAGSYPTSYIKTSGSAVTRNADVCNNAGNASTFNDSEGVLYAEVALLENDGNPAISISDGTNSNRIFISYNALGRLDANVLSGGTYQAIFNYTGVANTKTFNKIALKYKENDFALWVNGVEVDTDSSGITPVGLDRLNFATASVVIDNFYGKTNQILYFPTALTDEELAALTTI